MQEIFKKYKIKAKKNLGQNFLVNEKILTEISEIIEINEKNIIEVGPGFGALTKKILKKNPKKLTLIELDNDMIKILENRILENELNIIGINFEIKNIDILKYIPYHSDTEKKYSVIANIPYYITSPILRHFLYNIKSKPEKMVILMQKDVGDKILLSQENINTNLNKKNKIKSSVLGLFIAKKCDVFEKIFVGKENFIPSPKIESTVLLFESHNNFKKINDEKFLKIIKIGFSANRKKLIKNLEKGGFFKINLENIFKKLKLDLNSRPENLNIKKWCELVEEL